MTDSFKSLSQALIAVSLFGLMPACAIAGNIGGDTDKNGGGDTDKNGGGITKNGGGTPATPGNNGGGGSTGINQITCVINGRQFLVRSVSECGAAPRYNSGGGYAPVYRYKKRQQPPVYAGGYMAQGSFGYATGGYAYAPQPRVRYVTPSSRAAVMQAQKRERSLALGYAYGAGYAADGGYGQSDYSYGQSCICAPQRPLRSKKLRRRAAIQMQYQLDGYAQPYDYNPGYVIHYGPTLSKDGGY